MCPLDSFISELAIRKTTGGVHFKHNSLPQDISFPMDDVRHPLYLKWLVLL